MPKFSKSMRMKGAKEFLKVKRYGKSARAGKITVAAHLGEARRLGIIVSRKVGNAAVRNKLKRMIREHFRRNPEEFPLGDCVVIPKAYAKDVSNDEIRSDLAQALRFLAPKLISVIRNT
jgi:ribonuclease P protein component